MDRLGARDGATRTPLTSTAVSSEQAIEQVELDRVRGMMTGMAVSSLITAAIVIIVRGEPTAMRVHAGALTATAVAAAMSAIWFHREVAKWIVICQIVVLMTGYTNRLQEAVALGLRVLAKPAPPEQLIGALVEGLRSRAGA